MCTAILSTADLPAYNVVCRTCNHVFSPARKSSLWWRAAKCAEGGRLNAMMISGEECGCVSTPVEPNAPFRLFGYDDLCRPFDIPLARFIDAVRGFKKLERTGCTVFISGISKEVRDRIGA